jgi:hypothetical protein
VGSGGSDFLILLAVRALRQLMAVAAAGAVASVAPAWNHSAAFNIFFWFQITGCHLFIGLFSLCHFIS